MLVIIRTYHICSLQCTTFIFYQSSAIFLVHQYLFRMNMNGSKSISTNFRNALGSIQPWRLKCVLLSPMNSLSHIQYKRKNFISLHYCNTKKKSAFQNSLVKTAFFSRNHSCGVFLNFTHSEKKKKYCIFLLLAIQGRYDSDKMSWAGFWLMHQ